MADREKVIKGLECCLGKGQKRGMCEDCPYDSNTGRMKCNLGDMHVDALALLKAQEPVEPTEPDEDNMRYCGACGSPVGYEVLEPPGMDYIRYNYCPNCGKKVRWE